MKKSLPSSKHPSKLPEQKIVCQKEAQPSSPPGQRAFLLFECVFAILLIAILCTFAHHILKSQLWYASNMLTQALHYTKILALTQSTQYTSPAQAKWLTDQFPSINPDALIQEPTFWQMQFHQKGIYTKASFSLYLDTPRFAVTTNYDNRPMAADVIAIEGTSLRCLSGYNNTNISEFCKNNADTSVRLLESFDVDFDIKLQAACSKTQSVHISFDSLGRVYCADKIPLIEPLVITLKSSKDRRYICMLPPYGLIQQGDSCKKYL